MIQKEEVIRSVADYDIIFASIHENQDDGTSDVTESLSKQSETIRLIMEAVEKIEFPQFVTFITQ